MLETGQETAADIDGDVDGDIDGALDAGALLPADTALGERRDLISTRSYAHPALTGRTVVRLTPDALSGAEDLTMEFLGFAAAAEPVRVGVGRQQSLGFPAWALVHDPANGHHALNLVKDIERLTRMAATKPGHAKDGFDDLAKRLAGAVPHFLPTFYEQAARVFLGAENSTLAATFFGRAREAERAYSLTIDETAQGSAFLEFALAGALTAKALTEYSRALAARTTAQTAYAQFRRICVERVAGGLPPYTGMPADLRRLAKAAKLDTPAEDAAIARELLPLPATAKAAAGFWAAYRGALIRAAKADPRVRGLMLSVLPTMPSEATQTADDLWLAFLHEAGAIEGLVEGPEDVPAEARSADGSVGWLNRFAQHGNRGGHWRHRSTGTSKTSLLTLVEQMAPRLRAEATPLTVCEMRNSDIDLIDLCLALGLSVADPGKNFSVRVDSWLSGGVSDRDLSAFAADPRLRAHLYQAVSKLAQAKVSGDSDNLVEYADRLTAVPGLRAVLADWLDDQAALVEQAGLADLAVRAKLLAKVLVPKIIAVNPDAVRRITELDVAGPLGHALRAGIFDEYGWPALEQACARLAGLDPDADPTPPKAPANTNQRRSVYQRRYDSDGPAWILTPQWPYLVVQNDARAEVLDANGTRLEHTVAVPTNQKNVYNIILRCVEDQLLVAWSAYPENGAYFSSDPSTVYESDIRVHYETDSLELPWGGRTFGGTPLTSGAPQWSAKGRVATDGTDYWVYTQHEKRKQWVEFDPRTGALGRASAPAFFAKPVAASGEWVPYHDAASLRPANAGMAASPLGVAGGLVGFRTYAAADGTQICEGVDGRTLTIRGPRPGSPHVFAYALAAFPGAPRHLAVMLSGGLNLVDEDRKHTAVLSPGKQAAPYARGTWCVPPLEFWHYLTVRDAAGSAALRALSDDDVRALLDSSTAPSGPAPTADAGEPGDSTAADSGESRALAGLPALLPQVTNTRLRLGIAGHANVAAKCVKRLAKVRTRLEELATRPNLEPVAAPEPESLLWDDAFETARKGLCAADTYDGKKVPTPSAALELLGRLLTAETTPTQADTAHLRLDQYQVQGIWAELCQTGLALPSLAFRAACAGTGAEERAALLTFLARWGETPMAAPGTAWRLLSVKCATKAKTYHGTVIETGHGRVIVLNSARWYSTDDSSWYAIEYSRDGRFADVPGWKITEDERPLPWPWPGTSIAEFCEQASAHGTAPLRLDRAEELAQISGLSVAEAKILLTGLPTTTLGYSEQLPEHLRDALELKATAIKTASRRFGALASRQASGLVAALLPEKPGDLWDTGPRLEVAAALWVTLKGRQAPVPADLIAAADKIVTVEILQGLLNPAESSWIGGVLGTDGVRRTSFDADHLPKAVTGLAWLAYHLPYGDPLRAALPEAITHLRRQLAAPKLKVRLGYTDIAEQLVASLGYELDQSTENWRVGPLELGAHSNWRTVDIFPAELSGADDPALILLDREDGHFHGSTKINALRLLLGTELTTLMEGGLPQSADTSSAAQPATAPASAPYPAQDPSRSVPGLLDEVAGKLDLSRDAAAIYLMLLALPDPTDRNQAAWTGWKPARLKAAREELAAAKGAGNGPDGNLVVAGARPRAGRTMFLPGGWLALKSPYLPLEAWKCPLLGVTAGGSVPLNVIVPRRPVPDLFAAAWQRVQNGDAPRYDELTTGKKR